MTRLLSVAALGLAATAGLLATPATSHAQFGVSLDFGRGRGISFYQGSPSYYYGNGYYNNGYYGNGYGHQSFYYQPFSTPGYNWNYGYRSAAPVIVHPEYYHWTPGRGYHSHGHIHEYTPWGYSTRRY
jgi:hypothetical protein